MDTSTWQHLEPVIRSFTQAFSTSTRDSSGKHNSKDFFRMRAQKQQSHKVAVTGSMLP